MTCLLFCYVCIELSYIRKGKINDSIVPQILNRQFREDVFISELEETIPVTPKSSFLVQESPPPPPAEAPPPLRRSNLDEEGFKPPDILKRWQRSSRSGRSSSSNSLDSDADKRLSSSSLQAEASSIRMKSHSIQNLCSKFDSTEVGESRKPPPVPPKPSSKSPAMEARTVSSSSLTGALHKINCHQTTGTSQSERSVTRSHAPVRSMSENDAMPTHLQPPRCRSPDKEGNNSRTRNAISLEPEKTSDEQKQHQTHSSDVRGIKQRGIMSDKYIEASLTLSRNSSHINKEPSKNKWNTSFDKSNITSSDGEMSNLSRQKSSSTTNLSQQFMAGHGPLRRYVSQEDTIDQPGRLIQTREGDRGPPKPETSPTDDSGQRENYPDQNPQTYSGSVKNPRIMVNKYGIQSGSKANTLDSFRTKRIVSDKTGVRMPRQGTPVMKKWLSETSFHMVNIDNDENSDLEDSLRNNSLTSMFPWQTDLGRQASFKAASMPKTAVSEQISRFSREFSSDEAESSITSSIDDRLGSRTGSSGESFRFGAQPESQTEEIQNAYSRPSSWSIVDPQTEQDEVDFDAKLRSITHQLETVRQQIVEKKIEKIGKVYTEFVFELI